MGERSNMKKLKIDSRIDQNSPPACRLKHVTYLLNYVTVAVLHGVIFVS